MGVLRKIGRGLSTVGGRMFNIRVDRWVSYDYLKGTFKQTSAMVRDTFTLPTTPATPKITEHFEDAMQRMGLTEEDLKAQYHAYLRLCAFYALIFLGVLFYTVYMAWKGHFIGTLMALCLSLWVASFCFRYHYWSFQIKHRKLGCTLKEWFNSEISPQPE